LEDEGYKFYDKIMEASEEVRVKNEVKYLRDEEVRHKNFFQKQLKDKKSAMEDEKMQSFIRKEFIDPTAEYFDGEKIASSSDALRFGAVLEKKSIAFYQGIKSKETDQDRCAELDKIIEEEQKHLKKIYIILSY